MAGETKWDLGELLADADWDAILPRLVKCANRYLQAARWESGDFQQPSAMEVKELIHEAVKRTLEGRRNWNRTDEPDLAAFLCNAMRSICGHARSPAARAELRADADPSEDPEASAPPTPEQEVSHRERSHPFLEGLAEETADDEDMQMYVAAVEVVGHRREDIAAELDWSVDKVSVVKKRIKRRLLKRNATTKPGGRR